MNAKDEGQQWVLKPDRWRHSSAFLKSPTGATYRLPEDTARDLHGALDALQQQVTELEEERDHYRAALGTIRHHAASFSVYSRTKERARTIAFIDRVLTSPSTIAQEAQR